MTSAVQAHAVSWTGDGRRGVAAGLVGRGALAPMAGFYTYHHLMFMFVFECSDDKQAVSCVFVIQVLKQEKSVCFHGWNHGLSLRLRLSEGWNGKKSTGWKANHEKQPVISYLLIQLSQIKILCIFCRNLNGDLPERRIKKKKGS